MDGSNYLVAANTMSEQGGEASYVVKAIDANGALLGAQPSGDVSVAISTGATTGLATRGTDFDTNGAIANVQNDVIRTVTIGTAFTMAGVDDLLVEGNESYTVSLQDNSWTNDSTYENVTYQGSVTTTITDNDPAIPPDLAITKVATLKDVGGTLDSDQKIDSETDFITYNITVKNEGGGLLTGIKVYDPMFRLAIDSDASLTGIQVKVDGVSTSIANDVTGYYVVVNNLAAGASSIISYDYDVTTADATLKADSILRYVIPGQNQGTSVELAYGTFSAYVDDGSNPYSTTKSSDANVYVNTDNASSGYAIGVNAGTMAGDRNSNSDHFVAQFGKESPVEAAKFTFTNATNVDVAFKAIYGASDTPFVGLVRIYRDGNTDIVEKYQVSSTGVLTLLASANTLFTVDKKLVGQNSEYTVSYDPAGTDLQTFDFWVAGGYTKTGENNNNASIKVIDVGFSRSEITNTAFATSKEDTGSGQTDHISSASILVDTRNLPVVFDLDGNGQIDYMSLSEGVRHDFDGDGNSELTAWVSPNDGFLAMQTENGGHSISFSTQAGESDLEGLARMFDSNQDGVLDSSDAEFSKFGVWQDMNSNGEVDQGEFASLLDRGIQGLGLVSDNQTSFLNNGEVFVSGSTLYMNIDGTTGLAHDVALIQGSEAQPSLPEVVGEPVDLIGTAPPAPSDIVIV